MDNRTRLAELAVDPRRELREELEERSAAFETAPAGLVVAWAVERFGPKLALACSFQEAVLIDIAVEVDPGIEVIFLDTGSTSPRPSSTSRPSGRRYDLNLTRDPARWPGPRPARAAPPSAASSARSRPLGQALSGKDAWITGLEAGDAPTRRHAPIVSFDDSWGMVKINPLATWTDQDLVGYAVDHGIPQHPLRSQGYLSIGCAPTTARWPTGRTSAPGGGPTRTRPNAGSTSEMAGR